MSSDFGGWTPYDYYPSKAAAVIFIILFGVVTLLHTHHVIRTRTWFFIPLVVGGYCEFLTTEGNPIALTDQLTLQSNLSDT